MSLKVLSRSVSSVVVVVAVGCGGGGDPSPREACEAITATVCERLYACFTEAERAGLGLPATEAGCVTRFEEEAGCAAANADNVCDGNETYHADQVDTCVSKLSNVECSQFRDPNFDFDAEIPECDETCSL